MVAEADILAMLGPQPLSSLKVVEKLKGFAERIFNANVPAAVSPANLPLDIPPTSEPIQPGTPKMMPGEQPWKAIESDSVGIIRHDGTVRAWCIRENAGVEVFAKQHFVEGKPAACWSFTGTVDCEKVIVGSIFGGRNKANQIVRFIRDGLLAARMRLKHKRMNRQAKAASVPAVPTGPAVPTTITEA
ncbi:MAG: hypothetical protein IJI36_07785 [Kiritimatiellae bacterium]|nr:hypothetical protein [Kiritimatiellia bacterium]